MEDMKNGGLSLAQPSVDMTEDPECGATSVNGVKCTDCTVCENRCVSDM